MSIQYFFILMGEFMKLPLEGSCRGNIEKENDCLICNCKFVEKI